MSRQVVTAFVSWKFKAFNIRNTLVVAVCTQIIVEIK